MQTHGNKIHLKLIIVPAPEIAQNIAKGIRLNKKATIAVATFVDTSLL